MAGGDESVLRGGRLKHVYHEDNELRVIVDGTAVVFSSRLEDGSCALTVDVRPDAPKTGHELMRDAEARTIARVTHEGEQVTLHLEDGERFHVLAVTNEDGCRVATRIEREHSRGPSSLVDRVLGRTQTKDGEGRT